MNLKRINLLSADDGEILGVTLRFQERKKVIEYFSDNLTGTSPKLLKGASFAFIGAIRNCISSPIFIPLKGYPNNSHN